jgi:hypothetical protein
MKRTSASVQPRRFLIERWSASTVRRVEKTVYTIEKGVSSTARVTFEIKVNINAAPFADVYIDGDPPVYLMQTPLNQVTVPVGGTLTFKHSGFEDQKRRVASTDTNISIRF